MRKKLILNENKTEYLIFSPRNMKNSITNFITLKFKNNIINENFKTKYLGITLGKNFTFKYHINRICQHFLLKLRNILEIKHCLTHHTKLILFKTVLTPILTYCCEIYDTNKNTSLTTKLEKKNQMSIKKLFNIRNIMLPIFYKQNNVKAFTHLIKEKKLKLLQQILKSNHLKCT